ncbi:MAG: TrbI/VirB10 family protein, partial [Alphaproteobacteria bacterium]|nr:TrbI/VirB10 family protein [Alphaproteobacteria bacterium]
VVPGGNVVYGSSVVGRVGARGYIYRDSKRIGEIVKTGPVYDVLAHLKGQIMKNGTVISLAGAAIGRAHGRFAFDSNGTLMGGTTSDMLAIDNNNIPFGLINADSSVKKGNDTGLISPFGYVFNSAGSVIGKSFEPYAVYGVEGLLFSYITPNGYIYYNDQSARLTPSGVLLNKKGYVGGVVNPLYALNFNGNLLGIETQSNIIANNQGEPSYKILPGGYVVGNQKAINNAVAPIEGFAHRKMIALNINGNLLGYIDGNAVVYDLGGNSYGRVIYDDYIQDNNNVVVGKAVPFATVNNDKCNAVGVVNGRGDIVNNREVIIGRLLPNGQAISDVGSYVGYATLASGLIDFDGNYVGTVSAGKGIDINGKTLGCVNRQGQIVDGNKRVLYGVVESNPVINFDGNVIGDVMANGTVADDKNQIIGYIQPNGSVVSKSKKNIGQTMKYRVAYNNDNQFIGMVQHNGLVYEQSGEIIGQVMFDGSIQKRGEVIGYALYDFYVYDDSFVTHGYLTKDGTVLSSVGSKLGTVDRGFMVDKNDKVIARGNRDYVVRDASNNAVGELQMDGNVIDFDGKNIGYLAENGAILNSAGDEIAHARPLQYYSPRAKDETPAPAAQPEKKPEDQDWVDKKKVKITDIEDGKVVERPSEDEQTGKRGGSRVVGIALNPEGDIIGNIYDDDSVKADDGTQIGFRTPDGMVVDMNYNPIGIEEVKRVSAENMFVPADAFGNGNPYGIGTQPSNLGPGGGYGQGERYDRVRASALQQVQNQRRRNISVGKISTNIKVSSFTGYEEHGWPGMTPNKSTWRVDMSEMILQDKAIPAVLARSVYASEGFSTNIPITAIVERNIYAEEGRNIIIPAGSRVIGSLAGGGGEGSGGNSGGAVKIGITWNRLIRPDGSQFTFNSAQTADAQGRAGAIGYLDEQLIKKYSMPMLYTALETATAMTLAGGEGSKTTEGGTTTESSRSQALEDARQNFIDQMNNIFSDLLNRKKNIRSVTYIPAGTRIIIFPNEDLWLNSEKLEGIGSEGGNPDDGIGLTTDRPDEEGGAGNVSYSGNVQENVTPVQGGGNGAPNRPTGGVTPPPSVEATQGSDNSEDDIPDLM